MIIEKTTGVLLFLLLSAVFFADEPPLPAQTYKSYSAPQKNKKKCISAWREEELAGYRFDLISDTYIESFSFKKENNGAFEVRCVYGKRGGPVTGPVEYWHIDTDGYLYETDFMGGDFHAVITVSEKGIISGKIDSKQLFFNLIES